MSLRSLVPGLFLLVTAAGQEPRRRVLESRSNKIADLSPDGKFLLLHGLRSRTCPDEKQHGCFEAVLIVRASTGKRVGELLIPSPMFQEVVAHFAAAPEVEMLISNLSAPIRRQRWEPTSGRVTPVPSQLPDTVSPLCFLDGDGFVGRIGAGPEASYSVFGSGSPVRLAGTPVVQSGTVTFSCQYAQRKQAWLASRDHQLTWVGVNGGSRIPCAVFKDQLLNASLSPDGQWIAAVTRTSRGSEQFSDSDVMAPSQEVHLHLLAASDCSEARLFRLDFPEKPTKVAPLFAPKNFYWKSALWNHAAAKAIAISPDNTMLAVGYSVRTNGPYSDVPAYVAVYRLADGQRLARMHADAFRFPLLQALRYGDTAGRMYAAITSLRFSPDSRTLYAGSARIWAWDVSAVATKKR